MRFRFRSAAFAAALIALPVAALADSISVTNATIHSVHYEMRCADGTDGWHEFDLASLATNYQTGADWSYDCKSGKYDIRVAFKGTSDFNSTSVDLPADDYRVVFVDDPDSGVSPYDARNTITLQNLSGRPVSVEFHCTEGNKPLGDKVNLAPYAIGYGFVAGCTAFAVVPSGAGVNAIGRPTPAGAMYAVVLNNGSLDLAKLKDIP
jgi:hypothetical protein